MPLAEWFRYSPWAISISHFNRYRQRSVRQRHSRIDPLVPGYAGINVNILSHLYQFFQKCSPYQGQPSYENEIAMLLVNSVGRPSI